jgi:hypothetical protein
MPAADSCLPVSADLSALSPTRQQAGLPGEASTPSVHKRRIYKTRPQGVADFVVACPLVPSVSRLVSGSCASPRTFAPRFLQTPPRGDALALFLAFGCANTWRQDFHLASSVPCPAHTIRVERPRDQRLKEPHAPAAVRSNGWLDYPRTESGTTGLWNLDRPINPERTGRGWPGTPQSRSGVEHARGSMA